MLEEAGGLAYLGELARDTPSSANIGPYAEIMRERAVLRGLSRVGTDIAESALQNEGRSALELLDLAERKVFELAERGTRGQRVFAPIREVLVNVYDRIQVLSSRDDPITGVATGFEELDAKTAGLQRSDLIIVAGRPSMGKTSFAGNLVEEAAINQKLSVAVFSMEMPAEQLTMRMLSSLGHVDQHRVRTGRLQDADWPRLTSALTILNDTRIFIDDTSLLTPTELRARCRRLKREHGVDLVVVDYLQLMRVQGSIENRSTEISEISRCAQVACARARRAGGGRLPAEPQPRKPARQAPGDVGSARVRGHRAGCRRHSLHLPGRGVQRQLPRTRARPRSSSASSATVRWGR